MSTYAVNPATGVQLNIPALSIVTASIDTRSRRSRKMPEDTEAPAVDTKGKGKAVTTPPTGDTDYADELDMEFDSVHHICYRGDQYQVCVNCINAGVHCVNILNKKMDRLVCRNCCKRKIQCSVSEDSHTVIAKTDNSPSKTMQPPLTPHASGKRTVDEMGESFIMLVLSSNNSSPVEASLSETRSVSLLPLKPIVLIPAASK
jgi:hypothetical protein